MRQIALDTETTGLSAEEGHRIIEIACVEMIDRKMTGKTYHTYIHPEREIDSGAINVHGITLEFLKDKPKFAEIAEPLIEFIHDAELIIHNAVFDITFIEHELKLSKKNTPSLPKKIENKIIDTLLMARNLHPGQKNNLDALCKRYHIDNSKRQLHGALLDAHLLAHVYLNMTGGQGSLFQEEASPQEITLQENSLSTRNKQKHSFKIIKATADEINLHEQRMREILGG